MTRTRHSTLLLVLLVAIAPVAATAAPSPALSNTGTTDASAAVEAATAAPGLPLGEQIDANPTAPLDSPEPNRSTNATARIQSGLLADDADETGIAATDDEGTVRVVVLAVEGQSAAAAQAVRAVGGAVTTHHETRLESRIPQSALTGVAANPAVRAIREPFQGDVTETSEGVGIINASDVHAQGYTGENVTVGIIGIQGYQLDNPEIKGRIAGWKNFSSTTLTPEHSNDLHAHKVAEVVNDVAPNASLLLTRVDTATGVGKAADWLEQQGADVISMSVSFSNTAGALSGKSTEDTINDDVQDAIDSGIVWVNSAGNYADGGHWHGSWQDGNNDGWIEFDGSSERLELNMSQCSCSSGTFYLSWPDWNNTADGPDLYVVDGNNNELDSSTDDNAIHGPREVVSVSSSWSNPALAIKSTTSSPPSRLDIFTYADRAITDSKPDQSLLLPAVGHDVIAVGAAYRWSPESITGYSSRGPTIDGRLKPEVTAPTEVNTSVDSGFGGTSAAQPHVAGLAALALEANSSLTPADVNAHLRQSAIDIETAGVENQSGHGLVNATAMIDAITGSTNSESAVFAVSNLTAPSNATQGETVNTSATLTNTGNASDAKSVQYYFDGTVQETRNVSLNATESTTLTFSYTVPSNKSAGTYTHTVLTADDSQNATLEVLNATSFFAVSNLSAPSNATQGETITVSAPVTNTGSANGTKTVDFAFANAIQQSQNLTLAANASTTVSFNYTIASNRSTGTYTQSIISPDVASNATLTVQNASSPVTDLSLSPANSSAHVGTTATFDVVVSDADNGVGNYNVSLATNTSVATITDVANQVAPGQTGFLIATQSIGSNNGTAHLHYANADTSDTGAVTLATVTVTGAATGQTPVTLNADALATEGGVSYTLSGTTGATVQVSGTNPVVVGNQTAKDVDGDAQLEDITGDGSFDVNDVIALYNNLKNSAVTDNAGLFDFNGQGSVSINDVIALYNEL